MLGIMRQIKTLGSPFHDSFARFLLPPSVSSSGKDCFDVRGDGALGPGDGDCKCGDQRS